MSKRCRPIAAWRLRKRTQIDAQFFAIDARQIPGARAIVGTGFRKNVTPRPWLKQLLTRRSVNVAACSQDRARPLGNDHPERGISQDCRSSGISGTAPSMIPAPAFEGDISDGEPVRPGSAEANEMMRAIASSSICPVAVPRIPSGPALCRRATRPDTRPQDPFPSQRGLLAKSGWSIHVVLFEQNSADQPRDTGLVGEDADDIGAPLDLVIETCRRSLECDLLTKADRRQRSSSDAIEAL